MSGPCDCLADRDPDTGKPLWPHLPARDDDWAYKVLVRKLKTSGGNRFDLHPCSPGYQQTNCNLCDYRPQCWIHGGETPAITTEQWRAWPAWAEGVGR